MIEGLEDKYLTGALEALLFVTDEPVSVLTLATMLEIDAKDVEDALRDLQKSLEESDSGIQLREIAGGWRLSTHPRYHELIEKYVISWDTRKLSAAALETLAIIAYTQPVTRAQVSSVRGVSSDSAINSLVEKGLIREAGTADSPGNPTLYATTKAFLEKFGLNSVNDLTDITEFAPDEETKKLIADRLSSTRDEIIISDEQAQMLAEELKDNEDVLRNAVEGTINAEEATSITAETATENTMDSPSDSPSPNHTPDASTDDATSEMFRNAIASTLGVVDKINFDELEFDISDE